MIKIGYLGAEPDSENYGFELLEECQPVNIGLLGGKKVKMTIMNFNGQ